LPGLIKLSKGFLFNREAVMSLPKSFNILYNYFSEETKKVLHDVFYVTMKALYFKHKRKTEIYEESRKRKHKKYKGIFRLKRQDVSNAMTLVDFHLSNYEEIEVKDELAENFGVVSEGEALKYFDLYVEGIVKDIHNREVMIDEEAIRFMYKDSKTQEHSISSENYEEIRAKRLPWIRETLRHAKEIYEVTEKNGMKYLYVREYKVIFKNQDGKIDSNINYFLIVVRKETGKPLRFITAFPIDRYVNLLRQIEPGHPYVF